MSLDISKLSPMARRTVLRELDRVARVELRNINDDLEHWPCDQTSDVYKEMIGWRDALVDLRREIVKESK